MWFVMIRDLILSKIYCTDCLLLPFGFKLLLIIWKLKPFSQHTCKKNDLHAYVPIHSLHSVGTYSWNPQWHISLSRGRTKPLTKFVGLLFFVNMK